MSVQRGSTFWGKAPRSPKAHLYVVISDPEKGGGQVVIVNISSFNENVEEFDCILEENCHPRIKHKSYVRYVDGSISSVELIEQGISAELLTAAEPVTETVLKKIISGALTSKMIAKKCKTLLVEVKE